MTQTEQNKEVVIRFNREVIEQGSPKTLEAIMAPDFINHTAMPGLAKGVEGMKTVLDALRKAFPDLRVEIYDQIAEGEKVTTRKKLFGTHKGEFMGIEPTGKAVEINVIDIVTVRNGQYAEHWSITSLPSVVALLAGK